MRSFWDLSYSEIIELSEADLSKYIIREMMFKGLDGVEYPGEEPNLKEDIEVYSVGYHFEYRNVEAAKEVAEVLNRNAKHQVNTRYFDSRSFVTDSIEDKAYSVNVSHKPHEDQYEKHKNKIAEYREKKRVWDEQWPKIRDVQDDIKTMYRICNEFERYVNKLQAKFIEYIELAGDPEIASRFLRNNFDVNTFHEYRLSLLASYYANSTGCTDEGFESHFLDCCSQERGWDENDERLL